eukprot:7387358-Prymnesium_polylepis.3
MFKTRMRTNLVVRTRFHPPCEPMWECNQSEIRRRASLRPDYTFTCDSKRIALKNVGRESHTFLHHVIHNYDTLGDTIIFFQAGVNKRNEQQLGPRQKYETNLPDRFYGNNMRWLKEDHTWIHPNRRKYPLPSMTIADFFECVLHIKYNRRLKWCPGAFISVGKTLIRTNSRNYYKSIIRYLENDSDPEIGHFMTCARTRANVGLLAEVVPGAY